MQRSFVGCGAFFVSVVLPSAVVLAGSWGCLHGVGGAPEGGAT